MKKIFLMMLALLLMGLSCKDVTIKPKDDPNGKDPRTCTWTIDTLSYPGSMQTTMRDIWASSPTDVYVVGHNERGFGKMYHFNGISWVDVKLSTVQGGQINGAIDLFGIFGFGPNDVYAVGERIYDNPTPPPNFLDSSLIIHFDGVQWREIPIARGRYLSSIWGANSQDVWTGGNFGTLYHYIGGTWKKVSFDSLSFISSIYGLSSTEVYFVVVKEDDIQPHDSITYQLWQFNGNSMLMIDSYMVTPTNLQWKFGYDLWQTDQTLYSSGYGVYVMEGNQWQKFLVNEYPLHIGGSSRNNIFAVGDFGRIFHWSGADWFRLTAIENPNVQYLSVWANNKEAIIIGNDGYHTYALRGK